MKKIPLHSLVILIGPSKSGKTTLAANSFESYEVVSYSDLKEMLTGYDNRRDISELIHEEMVHRIRIKLDLGERVVVDGSHLKRNERAQLTTVAVERGVNVFYVVVNRTVEEKIKSCPNYMDMIELSEKRFIEAEREILRGDGIATIIDMRKETFEVTKKLNWNNVSGEITGRGYKGIMAIGDIHGVKESLATAIDWAAARNLFMLYLGDILDYGPHSLECVDIAYDQLIRGKASMIIGNHEKKIERWLRQYKTFLKDGTPVKIRLSEGNKMTTTKIEAMNESERLRFEAKFNTVLNLSANHIVIDDMLFTHAAAEPEMFSIFANRLTKKYDSMALYGEIDNDQQFKDDGFPNRIYSWVDRIPNGKKVIVGHDIRSYGRPLHETGENGGEAIFMDTGSGKGGHLTTAHIIKQASGEWSIENFTAH